MKLEVNIPDNEWCDECRFLKEPAIGFAWSSYYQPSCIVYTSPIPLKLDRNLHYKRPHKIKNCIDDSYR